MNSRLLNPDYIEKYTKVKVPKLPKDSKEEDFKILTELDDKVLDSFKNKTLILAHDAQFNVSKDRLNFTERRLTKFFWWLNYRAFLNYENCLLQMQALELVQHNILLNLQRLYLVSLLLI